MSYTDNEDGTFTDDNTGLMWEIKTTDGSVHDVGNAYSWSDPVNGDETDPDGTAFTDFLDVLNAGSGFAGYTDWRLPTVKELQSLLDYSKHLPAASFPGEVISTSEYPSEYWSSTSLGGFGNQFVAWYVRFREGNVLALNKFFALHVRAVRGGQ